ncbi:flagellar biosynthetic protein FliR [Natronospora cellulosivora (SeqCode)]
MTLGEILSNYSYLFILILIRFSGLFLITPIFSSSVIPVRIKVGLSFTMAIITMPLLAGSHSMPNSEFLILIEVLSELLIALVIGFILLLTFTTIQLAGHFIDMRMGFAIVNVTDPIHGYTMPLMGQFKNILAILLFLAINGHHILINSIHRSFMIIPLGSSTLNYRIYEIVFRYSADIFLLALKMALPIYATLFIADIILGFLTRTIPQLNIFVVGLPLKILVGFILLLFSIHFSFMYIEGLFSDSISYIYKILNLF